MRGIADRGSKSSDVYFGVFTSKHAFVDGKSRHIIRSGPSIVPIE